MKEKEILENINKIIRESVRNYIGEKQIWAAEKEYNKIKKTILEKILFKNNN